MDPVIIYIIGVSGSGKTTVGKKLSARTGIPFFDGDDFHPLSNKEKMKAGQALNDQDRAEWLTSINELAKVEMKKAGAIIACSALKEKYRTALSAGITVPLVWIFLKGSYELIQQRMKARKDHFMPPGLLFSQFEILEIPHQAVTIDISNGPDRIADLIMSELRSKNNAGL